MKTNYENNNTCPGCGRHCPVDDLHCPRGRQLLGIEGDPDERSYHGHHNNSAVDERGHRGRHDGGAEQDETIRLMLKCGHYLHHSADPAASGDLLSCLSESEKATLTALLKKCIENWG
ncbi:MAG: hypothetical protein ACI38A_03980 [Candidatus Ornithomonoglobus sp.]